MSSAITINLIAIAVVGGGWTTAVWAFYKRLRDPHARPETRRRLEVAQAPDASFRSERVLTGSRAA